MRPFWAAFAFYAWVIIYVAAPFVVTAFWLLEPAHRSAAAGAG